LTNKGTAQTFSTRTLTT